MAKRKPVRRYKTGSQVSAEKAQSAIDAKNEAASKAASDQSSGGSSSNPTKQGSTISSSASARAIAEKKAASDQSGRSSAASVAAPSGGRAESRAAQAPQAKAGSQVDDSVAQAAIAAKGLPGITAAGGTGMAPTTQAGGQLARDALLGKRDFGQTPMYDAAGNVVGQYGGERVSPGGAPAAITFNPDTGYMVSAPQYYPGDMGMPMLPEQDAAFVASRFRPLLEPQAAGQAPAAPYSLAGLPNPSGYDPQRMLEINQTPGLGMPGMPTSIVAGMEAPHLAGLRDIRAESNRIIQGAMTPGQAVSPSPAPSPAPTYDTQRMMEINQTPGFGAVGQMQGPSLPPYVADAQRMMGINNPTQPTFTESMRQSVYDNVRTNREQNAMGARDASFAEGYTQSLPDRSFMGPNTMADRAALSAPPRAVPQLAPAPSPAPTYDMQRMMEINQTPGFGSPFIVDEIIQGAQLVPPIEVSSDMGDPTPQPTTDFAAPQRTAPPAGVTPQQIAADTADTAGFRTAAANIARVPGLGPTVAGVLERVGSAFGDGDGPFGLPANERTTIDDFTEAQREMDRGSGRERRQSSGGIPFPGKGGGGGYRPGQQQPDNAPYIPPIGPPGYSTAPTTITPTPAYQSFGDLNAAAAQGFAGDPGPYTVSGPTVFPDVPVPAPYVPPPPVTGPGQPAPPSTPSTGNSFLDRLFGLFRGTSGMAGGGMVRPSMTNAFTPGSYYAAYDPFKRGIGGM